MYDDNQHYVSHHLLVLEYVQMCETLASMQSTNECPHLTRRGEVVWAVHFHQIEWGVERELAIELKK